MSQRSAVRMGRAGPKGVPLRCGSRGGRVLRGAGPEDLRDMRWLVSFVSRFMVGPSVGTRPRPDIGPKTRLLKYRIAAGAFWLPLTLAQNEPPGLAARSNSHRKHRGAAGT